MILSQSHMCKPCQNKCLPAYHTKTLCLKELESSRVEFNKQWIEHMSKLKSFEESSFALHRQKSQNLKVCDWQPRCFRFQLSKLSMSLIPCMWNSNSASKSSDTSILRWEHWKNWLMAHSKELNLRSDISFRKAFLLALTWCTQRLQIVTFSFHLFARWLLP